MTIHDVYTRAHNCEFVLSELTHKKSNHYFYLLFLILLTCLHIHFLLQYFYFLLYYYHLFLLVLIAMYFLKFYLCIDPYGTYTTVYFKHFSYLRTSLSFLTYLQTFTDKFLLVYFHLFLLIYLWLLIHILLFSPFVYFLFHRPVCTDWIYWPTYTSWVCIAVNSEQKARGARFHSDSNARVRVKRRECILKCAEIRQRRCKHFIAKNHPDGCCSVAVPEEVLKVSRQRTGYFVLSVRYASGRDVQHEC